MERLYNKALQDRNVSFIKRPNNKGKLPQVSFASPKERVKTSDSRLPVLKIKRAAVQTKERITSSQKGRGTSLDKYPECQRALQFPLV